MLFAVWKETTASTSTQVTILWVWCTWITKMNMMIDNGDSYNEFTILPLFLPDLSQTWTASIIHSESKKLCHYTFVHNFWQMLIDFQILSLLYSPRNLQQNPCHIAHHTLDVWLHYFAKDKNWNLRKSDAFNTITLA